MGLKQKAISGVKWNTVSTVTLTLVQILRLAVLTRLLEKSDFGLIAIATMVIGFTDIFSELGLTVAVIHKQNITNKQYSSVYWTNILLCIIVFSILWAVSPLLSFFYKEPILSTIIPLLGIQILLNGFGKMFQTIKSKNLEYAFLSKVRIFACFAGFVVTVVLALLKFGVYSLVIGQLSQVGIMQVIYAFEGRKGQKILWHLDFREISDFIKIGSFRLGAQILDFISAKIDVFLIGKFFGMDDLGIYNLAKDLVCRPYGIVNLLTSSVASSAFAQLQNDRNLVKSYYKKIVNIVSTITIPIYFAIFISADVIVKILYGDAFSEVSVLLRILTLYGIESSISSQGAILQVALGRTDIGFNWTIVRIIFTIGVIFVASNINIEAVAYGQVILAIISIFLFWLMAIRPIIKMELFDYMGTFYRPLGISLSIAFPIFAFLTMLKLNHWFQLGGIVIFSFSYFFYYWIFQKDFVRNLFDLVIKKKAKDEK